VTVLYTHWMRVSSLAYQNVVNGRNISFGSNAEQDPARTDLWNETIQQVASSLMSIFCECQTKIRGMRGYRSKRLTVVPYPKNDRNSISKMNEELTLWFVLNFLVSGSGIAKNTNGRARNPSVGCIRTNSNLLLAES
jgi:hypothetical protein